MKTRHVATALLALPLVGLALTLTGCGRQSASNADQHKVTKIEYWHVNAQTQGGKAVDTLVKRFNQTHKEVQVVSKYNPNLYKGLMQNFQSAQAAGKTPAITQVGWAYLNYFSKNFSSLSPAEAVQKFDSKGDSQYLDHTFKPNILALAKSADHKLVGLPYSLSTPILFVNNDLLKKAGTNPASLKTWEGVQAMAKRVKSKTGNYGLYIQEPADTWAQQALMLSHGADIVKNGKAAFDSPDGQAAYQFYQDMVVKDKTAVHTTWDQGVDDFVKGKVAVMYTTVAKTSYVQKAAKFNVSAVTSPTFKGHPLKVPAGGSMLVITAKDEAQQKAAWTFEKFLYQNDAMATWTKGTGYLPPKTGVAEAKDGLKDYIATHPMLKPAIEELPNAVPWTSFAKNGLEAEQAMIDARDKILTGQSVADTLKQSEAKINGLQ